MATEFERVLINRDNMTADEAKEARRRAHEELMEILEDGGDYSDVEDMLLDEFGLEMDYIFDILG